MTQGPTTIDGLLNTPEADIDPRWVVAYFTTQTGSRDYAVSPNGRRDFGRPNHHNGSR